MLFSSNTDPNIEGQSSHLFLVLKTMFLIWQNNPKIGQPLKATLHNFPDSKPPFTDNNVSIIV